MKDGGKGSADRQRSILALEAKEGSVLSGYEDPTRFKGKFHLWGDRLVLVGDINHRPRGANPEYWQLYTTDPANFKALGERWLATDKHQATGGCELQVYDAFADGLVFMRVFGGIRCYDLRGNHTK